MLVIVSRTMVFRSNAPLVLPCHNMAYSPDTYNIMGREREREREREMRGKEEEEEAEGL